MERKSHRPRARKAQRHARQLGERVALDFYGGTRIEGTLLDESTGGSGVRVLLPAGIQVKVRQISERG